MFIMGVEWFMGTYSFIFQTISCWVCSSKATITCKAAVCWNWPFFNIKVGLVLKTRKRLSSKFTMWKEMIAKIKVQIWIQLMKSRLMCSTLRLLMAKRGKIICWSSKCQICAKGVEEAEKQERSTAVQKRSKIKSFTWFIKLAEEEAAKA
jgi:hypothetical protein